MPRKTSLLDVRTSTLTKRLRPTTAVFEAVANSRIPDAHPGLFRLDALGTSLYPTQLEARSSGFVGEIRGTYSDSWAPSLSLFNESRQSTTGARRMRPHNGVDIYAPIDTPLVAIVEGKLEQHESDSKLGARAWLRFKWNGWPCRFIYGHLERFEGRPRRVKKGEVIGYAGCTGNADSGEPCSKDNRCSRRSTHVHLILMRDDIGKAVDPLPPLGWILRYAVDACLVPCEQVSGETNTVIAPAVDARSDLDAREIARVIGSRGTIIDRQGHLLDQLGAMERILEQERGSGREASLATYRAGLLDLLDAGGVALSNPENVDAGAPPRTRALTYRTLAVRAVADLSLRLDASARANVTSFLLHLAWHEGLKLTRRAQLDSGPARGFSQFEAHRARDTLEYAAQRNLIEKLTAVGGRSTAEIDHATAALPRYGTPRAPWFPAGNLIGELLRTVDLFNVYLTRIALMKVPAAIPESNSGHANYWFKHWKVTDTDPNTQRARFKSAADEVDVLVS